jgi:putative tryptophan/tyrosine transport system substrate-binding protein
VIKRRMFMTGLGAFAAAPVNASAQQPRKPAKIGLLDPLAPGPARQPLWDAFRQRLHELGYGEGEQVAFVFRSAHGQPAKLPGLASELVGLNVDVIVSVTTPATIAAKRATATIPIVMTNSGDPVSTGLVMSLAHPGGNVTGLTTLSPELSAKRLELLRDLAPTASRRVAVLWEEINPAFASAVRDTEAAARSIGVQVFVIGVKTPDDIERAFLAMATQQAGALIVMPGATFLAARLRLAELSMEHRIPAVYAQREYVEAGCLAAYGSSLADLFGRAGDFVVKILRGAKPADLPVEQPNKFEFVVNLKTAKALGLTIPPSLLLRADQVIE